MKARREAQHVRDLRHPRPGDAEEPRGLGVVPERAVVDEAVDTLPGRHFATGDAKNRATPLPHIPDDARVVNVTGPAEEEMNAPARAGGTGRRREATDRQLRAERETAPAPPR